MTSRKTHRTLDPPLPAFIHPSGCALSPSLLLAERCTATRSPTLSAQRKLTRASTVLGSECSNQALNDLEDFEPINAYKFGGVVDLAHSVTMGEVAGTDDES
ncbi:hypothetical protein DXG01_005616 [Tephrocybe rancida]|nr:hypothetical protein DXG01_005616 [Tephrocybe rancida]